MPPPSPDKLLHESKAGVKNYIATTVILLFSLGALTAAFLAHQQKQPLSAVITLASIGALLLLWFIFEFRGLSHVLRVFPDRIEELRFGKPHLTIPLTQPFAFYYAFSSDGKDNRLTVKAEGLGTIIFSSSSSGTSIEDIEALRDHLTQSLVNLIRKTLAAGKPFIIDSKLILTQPAIQIDGRSIPWNTLRLQSDDSTGDLRLFQGTTPIATRSMMDDNIIPFMAYARSRRQ